MTDHKDVFMRPMEYRPDIAMMKTSKQILMEELGLAEEDLNGHTSSSDSSDNEEASGVLTNVPTNIPIKTLPVARDEMKELRQMLRDTQRKLQSAQSSLSESESKKERRMKIIKKTHQSALALKQSLIQELQDIIAEKEEHIEQLETMVHKSDSCNGTLPVEKTHQSGLKRLVHQMSQLHKEHVSLQEKNELLLQDVALLTSDKERLQDELLSAKSIVPLRSPAKLASVGLAQQVKEMQQKLQLLERERLAAISSNNRDKELQAQVSSLSAQLKTLQDENTKLVAGKNQDSENLRAENSRLKTELTRVRSEAATANSELKKKSTLMNQLRNELQEEKDRVKAASHSCDKIQSDLDLSEHKVFELNKILEELEESHVKMEQECQRMRDKLREKDSTEHKRILARISQIRASAQNVLRSTASCKRSMDESKELVAAFSSSFSQHMKEASRKICARISAISEQNVIFIAKYRREMALRKKLHNKLVELKGNIRVLCRVRPPIVEDGANCSVVVEADREDDGVIHVYNKDNWKGFTMDKVFGSKSTQEEVFSEVKPLITSCLDGYNVCIFAYGQTGSGKTYTMEGTPENPGINQQALLELFSLVEQRGTEWEYSIVMSVVEIYNESVRDLLSVDHTEKMNIKQGVDGVHVPGLTQVAVSQLEEVNEVFMLGHQNRATGATQMNIHSSRSHALVCITVIGLSKSTGTQTIGKLNLIDLAGSERLGKSGSDGQRLLEAKHINKSLSALGDVINSLRIKSQHIPYRNSKLTYLLQDSLGGDSKTVMVVQVAPVEKNVGETVCSLNFGQRVRAVELGQASKRVIESGNNRLGGESPNSPMKSTRTKFTPLQAH